ncbi:MAG: acylneuraminate cytidylyltransferase family protein [Cyanobacteria bacterium]|nr:acylneuraminate cytidylyltransferase family protein [Cyanobacteriota bacterium]
MAALKDSIWGIVLSRKHSVRLTGKATRNLAGRPMIAYTFEAATKATRLPRCWVFSDDPQVLAIAAEYQIEIPSFERPASVSHNQATTEDSLRYFLSQFSPEALPEWLMLLQPTSPLRTSVDIDRAIELLENNPEADGLASVHHTAKPLNWTFELTPQRTLISTFQEDKDLVLPNGAIYIFNVPAFLQGGSLRDGTLLAYEMPWFRSVDVDTEEELLICQTFLIQELQHQV